ncbi:hypothetical protein [Ferrimonas balearica]
MPPTESPTRKPALGAGLMGYLGARRRR